MPDIQQLADSMLAAAVRFSAGWSSSRLRRRGASRNDHDGLDSHDGDELVTVAEIPSARRPNRRAFSEGRHASTSSPSCSAAWTMRARWDRCSFPSPPKRFRKSRVRWPSNSPKISARRATACTRNSCSDATLLPPPPFESYEGSVQVGAEAHANRASTSPAITLSKLGFRPTRTPRWKCLQPRTFPHPRP